MSKKFKKAFKALESRIASLEAQIVSMVELGIHAIENQINQYLAEPQATQEVVEVVAEPVKSKRGRKPKAEKTAEPVAEVVVETPAPVKEKKERKPYTRRTDAPKKEEIVYPANDLRNIRGIADALATRLAEFGVHNVHDFVNMTDGTIEQINEVSKGFAKKMETYNWKGQAQTIIDGLNA